jgi:hypothetical protein
MAKKSVRSRPNEAAPGAPEEPPIGEAAETELAAAVANREPDPVKPAAAIEGPETVSEKVQGRGQVQQAPGDAVSRLEAESMGSEPDEEEVRRRAYLMYLERGGGDGGDFDDWLRAEAELRRNRRA